MTKEEARKRFFALVDEIGEQMKDVDQDEFEAAVDEAVQFVRYGKQAEKQDKAAAKRRFFELHDKIYEQSEPHDPEEIEVIASEAVAAARSHNT